MTRVSNWRDFEILAADAFDSLLPPAVITHDVTIKDEYGIILTRLISMTTMSGSDMRSPRVCASSLTRRNTGSGSCGDLMKVIGVYSLS